MSRVADMITEGGLGQKRAAVYLDVLPGNEARPRAAQEPHGRSDIRGFTTPANE